MNPNKKCCSVIVTYKRKELLYRNIIKNLEQTAGQDIYIFDNSPDEDTKNYLIEKGLSTENRIRYYRNSINVFGAGGFFQGLEFAFSNEYEYAWLMDDDGYPMQNDTLQILLDVAESVGRQDVLLNSAVLCNENTLTFSLNGVVSYAQLLMMSESKKNLYRNHICPFNGTLISLETYRKIGNIRREFLIHGDETEYYNRALKNDIFIATVTNSMFYHPINSQEKIFLFNGRINYYAYSKPWLEYYDTRNGYIIRKEYRYAETTRNYIKRMFIKILCAPERKMEYFYYILRGMIAGIRNDFRPLRMHRESYTVLRSQRNE